MTGTDRRATEQEFHDRQASERAESFRTGRADLAFADRRDEGCDQVGLGRKIAVDGAGRDARSIGDRANLHGIDAGLGGKRARSRDDRCVARGEAAHNILGAAIGHATHLLRRSEPKFTTRRKFSSLNSAHIREAGCPVPGHELGPRFRGDERQRYQSPRAASDLARIASIVVAGLIACGSTFRCRIAGLPDSCAALKAAGKSSVFSIVAPKPPKARA